MSPLQKKIFLWIILILIFSKNAQSASLEIKLSDWGMQKAQEINFVSLGWNSNSPSQLVLYDLRKQVPQLQKPPIILEEKRQKNTEPLWLVPSRINFLNSLGGDYQSFFQTPSTGEISYLSQQKNQADFEFIFNKIEDHFVGFWIHLFNSTILESNLDYLDIEKYSYLTFEVRTQSAGQQFEINLVDENWRKKEDSISIGDLKFFLESKTLKNEWQRAWISLDQIPPSLDKKHMASIVITAKTPGRGNLEIRNMAFTQSKPRDLTPPSKPSSPLDTSDKQKAMWVWSTADILKSPAKQHQLVNWSQQHKITDIFLQIPYQLTHQDKNWHITWNQQGLKNLIEQLNDRNIRIHALDGAPQWALMDSHERVLAWVEEILKFQREVAPNPGFSGIHLDIEPYLLPGFGGINRESILRQYRDLLKKIRSKLQKSSLVLGIDIPFWMDAYNEYGEPNAILEGRHFSDWVMELADNVGLMSYRTQATGPDGVLSISAEEIQKANQLGKKLWIGLETTALPDETLLRMEKLAQSGPYLQIENLPQGKARLSLLNSRPSQGIVLGTTSTRILPGSRLSFFDSTPQSLETTMNEIKNALNSQPSFAGFALHSYESLENWLK